MNFTNSMNSHESYMSRCLSLAALGEGYTAPNPMVGAVLVHNNKIIGEGYHHAYGQPHAEPEAINAVADKSLLPQCTLYVNLEPCAHYGKTPPCADLIVKSGIKKVVIGSIDPNPKVAGSGIKLLKKTGIEVITDVLNEECRELNKRFFTFHEQQRPYIILKWAQTADGFIDHVRTNFSEPPLRISNSITQQLAHKMRTQNQAIMVGTNTVLLDNPMLTVRHWQGKQPVRIVIDRNFKIPTDFNIYDQETPTIIITRKLRVSTKKNIEYLFVDLKKHLTVSIKSIVQALYNQGFQSIMVEGGAILLNSCIAANLWDEAQVELSPLQIGNGTAAPTIARTPTAEVEIEGNRIITYKNVRKN